MRSVKAASDIYCPVSGTVTKINEELIDSPEIINEDPYGAWIIEIELSDTLELDELMDDQEYEDFCLEGGLMLDERKLKDDGLSSRYIPNTQKQQETMESIGLNSMDQLFDDIPDEVKLDRA